MKPSSAYHPGLAGDILSVTGEAIVDTRLQEIQTFIATFKSTNFVPDEESKLSWYPLPGGRPGQMVIRVEKGGANDGILGTAPISVSWFAMGR